MIRKIRARSGFALIRIVSSGGEVVCAFLRLEELNEATDGVPETVDGSFSGLAQEGLQLGEGVLDRVEVGAVGRNIEQMPPR